MVRVRRDDGLKASLMTASLRFAQASCRSYCSCLLGIWHIATRGTATVAP